MGSEVKAKVLFAGLNPVDTGLPVGLDTILAVPCGIPGMAASKSLQPVGARQRAGADTKLIIQP